MLPLFFIYLFITLFEQIYNIYIYCSWVPSCCPHGFRSVEGVLWVAEPRFELGPAFQQADALLSAPRRTFKWSTTRPVSLAAPFWATPHPEWATPHPSWKLTVEWFGFAQFLIVSSGQYWELKFIIKKKNEKGNWETFRNWGTMCPANLSSLWRFVNVTWNSLYFYNASEPWLSLLKRFSWQFWFVHDCLAIIRNVVDIWIISGVWIFLCVT
jgi:hypothetical protein